MTATAVSEPYETCSNSGCRVVAKYEIALPEGPIIQEKAASPDTGIGDTRLMTYSTAGVLTFGTMNDRADELATFSRAADAVGAIALAFFGTWIGLRTRAERKGLSAS